MHFALQSEFNCSFVLKFPEWTDNQCLETCKSLQIAFASAVDAVLCQSQACIIEYLPNAMLLLACTDQEMCCNLSRIWPRHIDRCIE